MYTPRSSEDILRSLLSRMIARTELTDLNEGSVLYSLMATFAEQIAEADVRLSQIRDQFTIDGATGTDLDDRVDELGLTRLPPTRASGSVTLSRVSSSASLLIPKGSIVSASSSGLQYRTQQAYTMNIGVTEITASVEALILGSEGNAGTGAIDTLVDVPESLISVTQTSPLTGADEETDDQLKQRAKRHLSSLARCQPVALEYASLSFTSSSEERATTAKVFESLERLGEVDVLIDDGTGLADRVLTQQGQTVTLTARTAGALSINIESPVVDRILVTRTRNALISTLNEGVDYYVARGRGIVHILASSGGNIGDTYTVRSYSIYKGLIAELQSYLEGDSDDVTSGWRGAGTDLRVLPAPVQKVSLDAYVVLDQGVNFETVQAQVKSNIEDYISQLRAGDPLYTSKIIDVSFTPELLNVVIYRTNGDVFTDVYPSTPRTVLRAGVINVITSTTRSET